MLAADSFRNPSNSVYFVPFVFRQLVRTFFFYLNKVLILSLIHLPETMSAIPVSILANPSVLDELYGLGVIGPDRTSASAGDMRSTGVPSDIAGASPAIASPAIASPASLSFDANSNANSLFLIANSHQARASDTRLGKPRAQNENLSKATTTAKDINAARKEKRALWKKSLKITAGLWEIDWQNESGNPGKINEVSMLIGIVIYHLFTS